MGNTKVKKSIFKKWWFWVIVVLVIGAIGGVINQNKTNSQSSKNNTTATVSTTAETTTVKETTAVPPTTKSAKEIESTFKKSCKTIDYKTLSRNPNKHKGENLNFTGEVIQVQESDSLFSDTTQVDLRINVTKDEYGLWDDTILATVELPEDADKILEDDIITIWGECDGDYTYESVLGSNITLPLINVEYFEIN